MPAWKLPKAREAISSQVSPEPLQQNVPYFLWPDLGNTLTHKPVIGQESGTVWDVDEVSLLACGCSENVGFYKKEEKRKWMLGKQTT